MSAHTPGPWFYDDGEDGRFFPHVVLGGADPKARYYVTINTCAGRNGGQMKECQANARLIAAAPDGLAFAVSFVEWAEQLVKLDAGRKLYTMPGMEARLREAREFIGKAVGL